MRPHGRASISLTRPRALGICQRCGFMYNRDQLEWQYQYGGPRLINLRVLVCKSCYDKPQAQLRTILLPPDPVSVEFPSQEIYPAYDNPLSAVGYDPIPGRLSVNIGNMTYGGGVNAAFDGVVTKTADRCAVTVSPIAGYNNYVGKFWGSDMRSPVVPSSLPETPITYNVSSFVIYGPSDTTIASANISGVFDPAVFDPTVFDPVSAGFSTALPFEFQGSSNGSLWTVLYNGTTVGTNGEIITSISSNLTTGDYQYHRIAFSGATTRIQVAQVQFNVFNTGQNEQ